MIGLFFGNALMASMSGMKMATAIIDLTAAFGVAGLGHGWSAGVMREQSEKLIHGMGDVHPTALKVEVCKLLSAMTFERWGEGVGKDDLE